VELRQRIEELQQKPVLTAEETNELFESKSKILGVEADLIDKQGTLINQLGNASGETQGLTKKSGDLQEVQVQVIRTTDRQSRGLANAAAAAREARKEMDASVETWSNLTPAQDRFVESVGRAIVASQKQKFATVDESEAIAGLKANQDNFNASLGDTSAAYTGVGTEAASAAQGMETFGEKAKGAEDDLSKITRVTEDLRRAMGGTTGDLASFIALSEVKIPEIIGLWESLKRAIDNVGGA
jgi:hypothetical protein